MVMVLRMQDGTVCGSGGLGGGPVGDGAFAVDVAFLVVRAAFRCRGGYVQGAVVMVVVVVVVSAAAVVVVVVAVARCTSCLARLRVSTFCALRGEMLRFQKQWLLSNDGVGMHVHARGALYRQASVRTCPS